MSATYSDAASSLPLSSESMSGMGESGCGLISETAAAASLLLCSRALMLLPVGIFDEALAAAGSGAANAVSASFPLGTTDRTFVLPHPPCKEDME